MGTRRFRRHLHSDRRPGRTTRSRSAHEHQQAPKDPGGAPRDDLENNPGIGMSKGASAGKGNLDLIEGDSTFEGDVDNDTNPQGGIEPNHVGRTNK